MSLTTELPITQGKTFSLIVRWETKPIIYKPIAAIAQSAPMRIKTEGAHGIPDGWRAAVVSVKGMVEANAVNTPPRPADYKPVTVIDAENVEINEVNAADFHAYVSGGYLQFNTPVDLTGYAARMDIKDRVGGTVLHSLTTENSGIVIDVAAHTIKLNISATNTAAFDWSRGVYDLEMVSASGVVTAILTGKVSVTKEVTE